MTRFKITVTERERGDAFPLSCGCSSDNCRCEKCSGDAHNADRASRPLELRDPEGAREQGSVAPLSR